jgi:hypothetical protein
MLTLNLVVEPFPPEGFRVATINNFTIAVKSALFVEYRIIINGLSHLVLYRHGNAYDLDKCSWIGLTNGRHNPNFSMN